MNNCVESVIYTGAKQSKADLPACPIDRIEYAKESDKVNFNGREEIGLKLTKTYPFFDLEEQFDQR
jgi:hypothetical protein